VGIIQLLRRRSQEIAILTSRLEAEKQEKVRHGKEIADLAKRLEREAGQRTEERKGRTEAERRLRSSKKEHEQAHGFIFRAIGDVR
ncbi:unnamed protein product, partial [Choristocarpus tenellus]